MSSRRGLVPFLILMILAFSLSLKGKVGVESFRPELVHPVQAIIPLPLQNTYMADPRVTAEVQVDSSGKVEDIVSVYASHVGLIQRAENLLRGASFKTDGMVEGESIRFEIRLPFLYPADIGLQMKTPIDDVEIMLEGVKDKKLDVEVCKPGELDSPLQLIDRGSSYMPTDADGKRISGQAKVEFYVNNLGEVRLPRILSSTNEEVSKAAIASVRDMKFTPPTRDGRPTVTLVRMPFQSK